MIKPIAILLGIFIFSFVNNVECNSIVDDGNCLDYIINVTLTEFKVDQPPLLFRKLAAITRSAFDALSFFNAKTIPINSEFRVIPKFPEEDRTNRNKNIAIAYAVYRVSLSVASKSSNAWREAMIHFQLDPDDISTDTSTAIGIGNYVGLSIAHDCAMDPMNQDGSLTKHYNKRPYEAINDYECVNTAYSLDHPSYWQPLLRSTSNGVFTQQTFVFSQLRHLNGFTFDSGNFTKPCPPPVKSNISYFYEYKRQTDDILKASRELDDTKKQIAEHFDNKLLGIVGPALYLIRSYKPTLDEYVHLLFISTQATFDTAIHMWHYKWVYNAVRPKSAINHVYKNKIVNAWGGVGRGTMDLLGQDWIPYIFTPSHPEYPAATPSFCASSLGSIAHYKESNNFFNYSSTHLKGSSIIEPGHPLTDVVIGPFSVIDDYIKLAGLARIYAGIHYEDAVIQGFTIAKSIGHDVSKLARKHINGEL